MQSFNRVLSIFKIPPYLLLANIIAVYLAIGGWNFYDVRYFIKWSEYIARYGLLRVYSIPDEAYKVAYPPLPVILFAFHHTIASWTTNDVSLWRLIDKLPLLVSFNLVYFILYKKYGKFPALLWIINLLIYIVIHTYQFDLLVSLFILLGLTCIREKKYGLYGVYHTLAALVKPVVGIVLVIPLVELLKKKNNRELLKYLVAVLVTGLSITLPFFLVDPYSFIKRVVLFHGKRPPQQLSIWAIPVYLVKYDLAKLPSWYYDIWLIPLGVFLLWIMLLLVKEKSWNEVTYIKYEILFLAGFMLLSKISNVNYFLWLTPPLLLFINKLEEVNTGIVINLVKVYLFTTSMISLIFGFFAVFVEAVSEMPIFIIEDWMWMPAGVYIANCFNPYSILYRAILYFRAIPAIRETTRSIALVHYYFLIVLCILYAFSLIYIMYTVRKYSED